MAYPQQLQALVPLSKVILDQKVEGWEVFSGFHRQNRYAILDATGAPVYSVQESSGGLGRAFLGSNRSFEMPFYDKTGQEVLRIKRPYTFVGDEAEVFSGQLKLGSIKRESFTLSPKIRIYDHSGAQVLKISGSAIMISPNQKFKIKNLNGQQIGEIRKNFSGMARELFSNADRYGVQFPMDLHVNIKALLMAATVLVDFCYFEKK